MGGRLRGTSRLYLSFVSVVFISRLYWSFILVVCICRCCRSFLCVVCICRLYLSFFGGGEEGRGGVDFTLNLTTPPDGAGNDKFFNNVNN